MGLLRRRPIRQARRARRRERWAANAERRQERIERAREGLDAAGVGLDILRAVIRPRGRAGRALERLDSAIEFGVDLIGDGDDDE